MIVLVLKTDALIFRRIGSPSAGGQRALTGGLVGLDIPGRLGTLSSTLMFHRYDNCFFMDHSEKRVSEIRLI